MLRPVHIWACLLMMAMHGFSCQKDNRDYAAVLVQLPTELELTDICFMNKDTGFVTAGNLFSAGLVLQTNNGGLQWDTLMQTGQGCNSIAYQNNRLTVSECGNKLHYTQDFVNWSYYSTIGWWRWHQHIVLENEAIVLVGGGNYSSGYVHCKKNNGPKLEMTDSIEFELCDLAQLDDGSLHAVGYGLIMQSKDKAASWQMSTVEGDFFRGIDFPTQQTGYVVGEYGAVYKTTNAGDDWTMIRGGHSLFGNPAQLMRDIAFYTENDGLIVGTANTVLSTDNGGKSWKKVENIVDFCDFQSIEIAYNKAYLTAKEGKLMILDLDN